MIQIRDRGQCRRALVRGCDPIFHHQIYKNTKTTSYSGTAQVGNKLLATLVAITRARPEPPVSSGYSYPVPSSSYGAPSLGSLGGLGLGGHGSGLGGSLSIGGGGLSLGRAWTISRGSFSSGFDGGYAGGYGGGAVVQKHIYVHVPPPEPEEIHHHRPIHVAPPQKHYKIIFIKAPTQPTPTVPTIPIQPQNEEKTLKFTSSVTRPKRIILVGSRPELDLEEDLGGGLSLGGGGHGSISLGGGGHGGLSLDAGSGLSGGHGASFSSGGSLDGGLAISGGSSHSSSLSSSISSSSAGLSTSYGPPRTHQRWPILK
ncbi:hypothetical protein NQ317_000446 [Molorchus minor]|uniref:DUF243 domain-containing protein n=1 Tax=Molorchus minor TaxID=1323400 RepID=A0ABQ9JIG9_9CUCU|nr:hypothetical protein NQ317_000446 [Molorchus minor]